MLSVFASLAHWAHHCPGCSHCSHANVRSKNQSGPVLSRVSYRNKSCVSDSDKCHMGLMSGMLIPVSPLDPRWPLMIADLSIQISRSPDPPVFPPLRLCPRFVLMLKCWCPAVTLIICLWRCRGWFWPPVTNFTTGEQPSPLPGPDLDIFGPTCIEGTRVMASRTRQPNYILRP